MDGAIEGRIGVGITGQVRGAVAQEVVPAAAAPCLWLQKIGGVTVEMEDHVTVQIADGCARMGSGVVEEPEDLIVGLLGGLGLLGGDRAEGGKHGQVEGYGILQQVTDDLLDEGDGLGWQYRRFVRVIGPLDRRAIPGCFPGMGGILEARWRRMLELVEGGR